MKRPGLRNKSAEARGGNHLLLQAGEARGYGHIRKKDAGAMKETQLAKLNGNGRRMHRGQPRRETIKLLRRGVAQELQRDVP